MSMKPKNSAGEHKSEAMRDADVSNGEGPVDSPVPRNQHATGEKQAASNRSNESPA
jgi:hypothetical protein